jgi:DNA-binding CsgD family transcriptional regulator
MRDWRAAGTVSAFVEDSADGITVEVRLSDEALARWISDWIAGSAAFTSGAAHGPRSVLIADHVPDDVDTAIVLLGGDDVAGSRRDAQVSARLTPPVDFVKLRIAVEAAAHGLSVFEPSARFGPADDGAPDLTAREIEVLHLLAEGASNKIIARSLGISAHTAKFHVASILKKLDATSRTEAVTTAIRLGLLMV